MLGRTPAVKYGGRNVYMRYSFASQTVEGATVGVALRSNPVGQAALASATPKPLRPTGGLSDPTERTLPSRSNRVAE
jgi:hypothetical protein